MDNIFINMKIPSLDKNLWVNEIENLFTSKLSHKDEKNSFGSNKFCSFPLSNSTISLIRSAGNTNINLEKNTENITVIIVISGEIEFQFESKIITRRRADAIAFNSALARHMSLLAGTKFCVFRIATTHMIPLWERLFGHQLDEQLQIAAEFDIISGTGRALTAVLTAAVTAASAEEALSISPHAAHFLQSSLVSLLLENLPHNYSRVSRVETEENIPINLKKAATYITENADKDITTQDITQTSGVGIRSLQQNFQKFFQLSPAEYIRNVKLQGVRRDLQDQRSQLSIEEIARKWGFTNRGHFAAQYRKFYNELPSKTRKPR
uniref:Helix-turn-helix domain-containing protein n=1 Tax=Bosea sp. NBC_00436 TaxID=2969620 RepID=A0A9E7ZIW9_9HYPH